MKYQPRLKPRKHQAEALRRLARNSETFALLMDMGTGKSKVALDEWGERVAAGDVSDLLIVAPAGCYRNWIDDASDSEPSEIRKQLDPALFERLAVEPWVSGGSVARREAIERLILNKEQPRIFVVNIEALSKRGDAFDATAAFIATSRKGVIFTVDESTTIKGHDAQRTENVIELGDHLQVAARRIMTGLVTPNSPLDLYSQFNFLDWRILGFRSWYGFRARYAKMRNAFIEVGGKRRKIKLIDGYRNLEELHANIAPYSFRVLKEECLDLPPKIYMPPRHVELTDEQRRIYREVKEFATSQLSEEAFVTVSMVLAQRTRLDQILCGFTVDEVGELHEIPERRTEALLAVLGDYAGKAIIWTSYDHCVRKIGDRLRKEFGAQSVAQFWGGNRATRGEDERRFKGDPACRFMVATPAAGGRGNTWVVGGLSVFYNNTDNLEHRAQAEDRNHRDGLTGPMGAGKAVYHDLIAPGTLDMNKVKNLRNKIDIASMISGDPHRDWLI